MMKLQVVGFVLTAVVAVAVVGFVSRGSTGTGKVTVLKALGDTPPTMTVGDATIPLLAQSWPTRNGVTESNPGDGPVKWSAVPARQVGSEAPRVS